MKQCLGTHDKAKHNSVSVGGIYKHTKVKSVLVHLCPGYISKAMGNSYPIVEAMPLMLNQKHKIQNSKRESLKHKIF